MKTKKTIDAVLIKNLVFDTEQKCWHGVNLETYSKSLKKFGPIKIGVLYKTFENVFLSEFVGDTEVEKFDFVVFTKIVVKKYQETKRRHILEITYINVTKNREYNRYIFLTDKEGIKDFFYDQNNICVYN